ncbi:hypothetical protein C0J52_28091 [Blattella germanica]|nr:hypothetical protein C0J52_28091 [Blattella germanica]
MEQRRFTLRHLKEFGFGKKSMGNIISEEVEETIKEMSDKQTFQCSQNKTRINFIYSRREYWHISSSDRGRNKKSTDHLFHVIPQKSVSHDSGVS